MGRRSRKADPGAVNTVTRVRHKSSEAEAKCSWEPQDPSLWRRILHCEWMEEEGWKLQKGSHKDMAESRYCGNS